MTRNCCICNTADHSGAYKVVDGHNLRKCRACGLVFLDGASTPETFISDAAVDCKAELEEDDKATPYYGFPQMYAKYQKVFDGFFEERLRRCKAYHPAMKTMFDIGSGYGFWMSYCQRQGLSTKGIDLSPEAVQYAKEKMALDTAISPLKPEILPKGYDLYNFCDVLEHLEDPNQELRVIREAMGPESLLFIQVPDVIGLRISYKYNMCLPHHLWQFNYPTLKRLVEKNGFEIVNRWHGVLGVIGHYEKNEVTPALKLKWRMANWLKIGNRLMILCRKAK